MATPILTKKQQRHSLSAKKTPVKGLRNVLAQPQDVYWPAADVKQCSVLEKLLKQLTPAIRRPSCTIPWSQLRQMKKEERIEARKEALLKDGFVPDKELVNAIVTGINAVTRSLEKNNVCCVLLDTGIEPSFLIKHILIMCQNKKVPILLVPFLKSVTRNSIGYGSAALALKTIVAQIEGHHFHQLYTSTLDILKDMPLPKNRLKLFPNNETDESELEEDTEMCVESEPPTNVVETNKITVSTDVYKYRSSRKERAFIPPNSSEKPVAVVAQTMECSDFISLDKYASESDENEGNDDVVMYTNRRYVNVSEGSKKTNACTKSKGLTKNTSKKSNVQYLSLKVKRLQGNSNRVKATKVPKKKRRELEKA